MTRLKSGGWEIVAFGCGLGLASLCAAANAPDAPPATSPSNSTQDIQFQRGRTDFEGGDTIIITSVRGPADSILPGNTYEIQGTYILSSHDDARLAAGVQPMGAGQIEATPDKNQSEEIDKGMGKFDLTLPVPVRGYPFLSLNSTDGNVSFGEIFFGTLGTVLQASSDDTGDSAAASAGTSAAPMAVANQNASGVSLDVNTAEYATTFGPPFAFQMGGGSSNFQFAVNFQNGARRFAPGDNIMIQEIRGTAATFATGNQYQITGVYSLTSQAQAQLAVFVTTQNPAKADSSVAPGQVQMIQSGTGNFTLILNMTYPGNPHVSFYPASGGASFGSAYFGTAGSTLQTIPDGLNDNLNFSVTNNVNPYNLTTNSISPSSSTPPQPAKGVMPTPTFPQGQMPNATPVK